MITNTELERKGNQFPGPMASIKTKANTFNIITENDILLQVTVIRDSIFRFRYATEGNFPPDFSYALDKNAPHGYNHLESSETATTYIIKTSKLVLQIDKRTLKKRIYDLDGVLINEDEAGFHWEFSYEHGSDIVKMSKLAQKMESYYGLGDKPMHFNLKGKRVENWVTDQYAFGKDQDPLYKSIPFYVGLHSDKAYGIFFVRM